MNSDPEEDLPVGELPEDIGEAASEGDFERVKAWLAGGSASDPRSINAGDEWGGTLLNWTVESGARTPEHVEFARYLISRGARVDQRNVEGSTALHFACECITNESTAAAVSVLVAAGAACPVPLANQLSGDGHTPLFSIDHFCESTIDVVTALLRAGASLDSSTPRLGFTSFERHLNLIDEGPYPEHFQAVRNLVASVRAAGSWKAHCISPHKQVLRLRSLVVRGRAKLPRTRRPRGCDARQKRALEFVVRQGDNGIVWHILSFWRETA
jgi:hypothetical protein